MSSSSLIDQTTAERRHKWRRIKDLTARWGVATGGIGVIIAILLIFFFLLVVVFPLFQSASMKEGGSYGIPGGTASATRYLTLEEQGEVGGRIIEDGRYIFFRLADGEVISSDRLPLPAGRAITSIAEGPPDSNLVAVGLSDGSMLLVRLFYRITYPNDQRKISPELRYPFGETPLELDDQGMALTRLAFENGEDRFSVAAYTAGERTLLISYEKTESMLGDGITLERSSSAVLPGLNWAPDYLLMDPTQNWLYLAEKGGETLFYDIRNKEEPYLLQTVDLVGNGAKLTSLKLLLGGISLLASDSDGIISQWFPVRDGENRYQLQRIRDWHSQEATISAVAVEPRRKGFAAADSEGEIGLYHSTAHRTLLVKKVSDAPLVRLAMSPRANALIAEDNTGKLHFWHVHNEHPEVSWSALWGKVWYESYDEPAYAWQSSAASNDFEPKFSLVPISFGTLKAAFYAMLLAAPLSILGAVYTAYFMAPGMRQLVKPTIEIMEALPTVILGFLAGLWLAPMAEEYLPGIVSLLLLTPISILIMAWCWRFVPGAIRHRIPDGWEGALLIPVILIAGWISIALSQPLELWLFDGNLRGWLTNDLGIPFDQRNSIVVGLTMGFAVIPTIFSIAEDAVFGVPRHLTMGSLALGATPWQTMWRVVLLTASPGIFSAIMIGFGRAVGETMIVLMATGNTPVMDFSIFQGMRTLSANIAVEMPESEVASTHYRVLFLAGLVLFLFTFLFNTTAEIIRQRLRRKYSSL
ncbi:phosphate ABC transporter permease [Endothiovibrio diazotrophicus]